MRATVLILATLLGPALAGAQAPPAAAPSATPAARTAATIARPSVTALAALLRTRGEMVTYSGRATIRSAAALRAVSLDGCAFELETTRVSAEAPSLDSRARYRVRLTALSPEVDYVTGSRANFHRIDAVVTSGAPELPFEETTPRGTTADSTTGFTLFFQTLSDADSAAVLLSTGIRACGGTPQTPAVKAAALWSWAKTMAEADTAIGRQRPAVTLQQVTTACRVRARDKFPSPSSTRFHPPSVITAGMHGGLLVIGRVERLADSGAAQTLTYTCELQQRSDDDDYVVIQTRVF